MTFSLGINTLYSASVRSQLRGNYPADYAELVSRIIARLIRASQGDDLPGRNTKGRRTGLDIEILAGDSRDASRPMG